MWNIFSGTIYSHNVLFVTFPGTDSVMVLLEAMGRNMKGNKARYIRH